VIDLETREEPADADTQWPVCMRNDDDLCTVCERGAKTQKRKYTLWPRRRRFTASM